MLNACKKVLLLAGKADMLEDEGTAYTSRAK